MALPLVFIHGLGCASSIDFANVGRLVTTDRRIMLVDLPGAAGSLVSDEDDVSISSMAAFVADRLSFDDVSQAVFFGHSMGGAVVLSLAAKRPEMVAGIVLAEANLDPGGGLWSKHIADMSETDFVAFGHKELIAQQRQQCSTWADTVALTSPLAMHRQATSLVEGTTWTWRQSLYNMQCPRFFIFGAQSVPDPDTEELPRHGISVLTLEHAGHNMAYENPNGLANVISDCLCTMP
ncbi:MAG: alpha/beta hydrolase [Propionibacteriaceae bacterium]|nr:alpha/beta hydrolase [Propionibacteriaceae bacterium]